MAQRLDIMDEATFNTMYSPVLPFPEKVVLQRLSFAKDEKETYFRRKDCYVMVTLLDEEGVIGHSTCSLCNNKMDIFDKFCPHCGAKSKGRKIVNGDDDETS